jgi:hypothetical protein
MAMRSMTAEDLVARAEESVVTYVVQHAPCDVLVVKR